MNSMETELTHIILKGFRQHFKSFMEITSLAKHYFEKGDWAKARQSHIERLGCYDLRVSETVTTIREKYSVSALDEPLWKSIKQQYSQHLLFHPQAELAETFYNSVFCNLFSWPYYNNNFIFVKSTLLANKLPVPITNAYQRYFPAEIGIKKCLKTILTSFNSSLSFENMHRDIRLLIKLFIQHARANQIHLHQMRLDVINTAFYRNKAIYIIGRVVTAARQIPFALPIIRRGKKLVVDALIIDKKILSMIFGFYRTYFMVQTESPSALVYFLQELMPEKKLADLYSIIGLYKQGKTEFYRDLLCALDSKKNRFVEAPGIEGLVMFVFTLPGFPYVFKIIRDVFGYNKDFGPDRVKSRYYLVKSHDRVGRMADTMEYSNVALPRDRFDPALLEKMLSQLKNSISIENNYIIIKHLYIKRRMIPLNIYLDSASPEEQTSIIREYGQAIKDMLSVNIFPGDMLFKNFGVSPSRRVVFYDYDEVQYFTDMNIRKLPIPCNEEQEMASEPWYTVMPNDFFPEELLTFVTTNDHFRNILKQYHADLLDPAYWQAKQAEVRKQYVDDIYPYPQELRFRNLYPEHYSNNRISKKNHYKL